MKRPSCASWKWTPSAVLVLCTSTVIARAQTEPPPPPAAPQSPALPPCAAPAPGAYAHDGFYFRLGLGVGYESVSGSGSSGSVSANGAGAALTLMIGGTPLPGVVLGGVVHGVAGSDGTVRGGAYDGARVSGALVQLSPFIDWYPDPRDGWHVGAMVGLGGADVSGSNIDWSSYSLGATAFGGYDWWIGPQWSLGILLAASAATPAWLEDASPHDSLYRVTPTALAIEGALLLH